MLPGWLQQMLGMLPGWMQQLLGFAARMTATSIMYAARVNKTILSNAARITATHCWHGARMNKEHCWCAVRMTSTHCWYVDGINSTNFRYAARKCKKSPSRLVALCNTGMRVEQERNWTLKHIEKYWSESYGGWGEVIGPPNPQCQRFCCCWNSIIVWGLRIDCYKDELGLTQGLL